MLRSANRGVSAIIDNKGNIIKRLNRNEAGNIEFQVPLIKSNKIKMIWSFLYFNTYLYLLIYKKKMQNNKYLFTSESVSEGIPIKSVTDPDMVVDSYLSKDPVSSSLWDTYNN